MFKKTKIFVAFILGVSMLISSLLPVSILADDNAPITQEIDISITVDEDRNWILQAESKEQFDAIYAINIYLSEDHLDQYYYIDHEYEETGVIVDENNLQIIFTPQSGIQVNANLDKGTYRIFLRIKEEYTGAEQETLWFLKEDLEITYELLEAPALKRYEQKQNDSPYYDGSVHLFFDEDHENIQNYIMNADSLLAEFYQDGEVVNIEYLNKEYSHFQGDFKYSIYMSAQTIGQMRLPSGNYEVKIINQGYKPVCFDMTLDRGYSESGSLSIQDLGNGGLKIISDEQEVVDSIYAINFHAETANYYLHIDSKNIINSNNVIEYKNRLRQMDITAGEYEIFVYTTFFGTFYIDETFTYTEPSAKTVPADIQIEYDEKQQIISIASDDEEFIKYLNVAVLTDENGIETELHLYNLDPVRNPYTTFRSFIFENKIKSGEYQIKVKSGGYESYTGTIEITNGYLEIDPSEVIFEENEDGDLVVYLDNEKNAEDFVNAVRNIYTLIDGNYTLLTYFYEQIIIDNKIILPYNLVRRVLPDTGEYDYQIVSNRHENIEGSFEINKELILKEAEVTTSVNTDDFKIEFYSDDKDFLMNMKQVIMHYNGEDLPLDFQRVYTFDEENDNYYLEYVYIANSNLIKNSFAFGDQLDLTISAYFYQDVSLSVSDLQLGMPTIPDNIIVEQQDNGDLYIKIDSITDYIAGFKEVHIIDKINNYKYYINSVDLSSGEATISYKDLVNSIWYYIPSIYSVVLSTDKYDYSGLEIKTGIPLSFDYWTYPSDIKLTQIGSNIKISTSSEDFLNSIIQIKLEDVKTQKAYYSIAADRRHMKDGFVSIDLESFWDGEPLIIAPGHYNISLSVYGFGGSSEHKNFYIGEQRIIEEKPVEEKNTKPKNPETENKNQPEVPVQKEVKPSQPTTNKGATLITTPYKSTKTEYSRPEIEISETEEILPVDHDKSIPEIIAKMDKSVYSEPVKLSVKILDTTTEEGKKIAETIEKTINRVLEDAVKNNNGITKAGKIEKILLLDLDLLTIAGNQSVQPIDGKVTISIPLPDDYDPAKTVIAHMKANGTVEILETVIKDGWITFTADSFSPYAILQLDIPVAEAGIASAVETIKTNPIEMTKAGENSKTAQMYIIILVITMAAIITTRSAIVKRQKT